jgi:hypothetical protein
VNWSISRRCTSNASTRSPSALLQHLWIKSHAAPVAKASERRTWTVFLRVALSGQSQPWTGTITRPSTYDQRIGPQQTLGARAATRINDKDGRTGSLSISLAQGYEEPLITQVSSYV